MSVENLKPPKAAIYKPFMQPLCRYGVGPVLGSGKQLMCFISRDDLIRAIEHIIACEQLVGPVNVLAPEPVTNEEFAKTLGRSSTVRYS